MKTIEEKAKAYDEAIRKLRGMMPNWERLSYNGKTFLQDLIYIIPELAESEDEKMRKELIKHLKELSDWKEDEVIPVKNPSYYRQWASWLEKQGQVKESTISQHENKMCKENDDSLTSENDRIRREIINYFQCQSEEEPTRKEIHNKWIAWIERQGEKDAITFNNAHIIDAALNDYCCKQYDALHKENGGVLSFARLQHLAIDIYGWCKGQIEQNPAWSEEERLKEQKK